MNQTKIKFSTVHIHLGHSHPQRVTKSEDIIAATPGKRVRGTIKMIIVICKRCDMNQALGWKRCALHKKSVILYPRNFRIHLFTKPRAEIIKEFDANEFALCLLGSLFAIATVPATDMQIIFFLLRGTTFI